MKIFRVLLLFILSVTFAHGAFAQVSPVMDCCPMGTTHYPLPVYSQAQGSSVSGSLFHRAAKLDQPAGSCSTYQGCELCTVHPLSSPVMFHHYLSPVVASTLFPEQRVFLIDPSGIWRPPQLI